ncbi:dihydroorotase [Spiroplasma sp. DGKH1]|uniref:dihydroorotase n=1 Tax=Spiroplasma sp. DGKH1 TaxID=3050074 RepID=UPI0034C6D04D
MIYTFSGGYLYLENEFVPTNISIEDNKIINIGPEVLGTEIKLTKDMIITPSFIDLHAHFREPGQTHKEDLHTGALSGLYGGYQTVCLMANTTPTIDNIEIIKSLESKLKAQPINLQLFSAITKGIAGQELVDLLAVNDRVIGYSDDGNYLVNHQILKEVLTFAHQHQQLVSLHVDSRVNLTTEVILNHNLAKQFNLPGLDNSYEYLPLIKDLDFVIKHQLPYHLCHVSTKESIELLRQAKQKNKLITCEVTPHHLTLSYEDAIPNDANYKMNPPLNSQQDQQSLITALNEGLIDVIATDHAPHHQSEKTDFKTGAMGIIGLQLAFPTLYTKLVKTQQVPLKTIIKCLTTNPQKLINHPPVELVVGNLANFVVINLAKEQVVSPELLKSKSKNTPFLNQPLVGWPIMNIYQGTIYHLEGEE